MNRPSDPLTTPPSWRSFLYDEVLVPWETGTVSICKDVYRQAAIQSSLGIEVLKFDKLCDLQAHEPQIARSKSECIAFYCDGKGYEALFKRLRDTTAHAHYSQQPSSWILLRHAFKGRGERKAKLRLIGRMKFTTLKRLVSFLKVMA